MFVTQECIYVDQTQQEGHGECKRLWLDSSADRKPHGAPNPASPPPPMQSPTRLRALKVAYADALWTLTPTAQLPFTGNAAPPFWIIKNIIFLPANFLC